MYDTWRGSDVDNMPPKEGEWGQEHLYGPWQVLVHVGSHQWHACRGAWAAGDLNAASPRERTGMIHHDPHRHLSLNIKTNKDRWYWYCMMWVTFGENGPLPKLSQTRSVQKYSQTWSIQSNDQNYSKQSVLLWSHPPAVISSTFQHLTAPIHSLLLDLDTSGNWRSVGWQHFCTLTMSY